MKNSLYRIPVAGGVLSPSELKNILELADNASLETIMFGSRQDILFPLQEADEKLIDKFSDLRIERLDQTLYQNIVCSYVAADIFPSTGWLLGSTYLYILGQFRQQPKLEVNITDPKQRLVPLFTGHLNFIASEHDDYWFLYVKLPGWSKHQVYPVLTHTWDIAKVVYGIEKIYDECDDIDHLFQLTNANVETDSRTFSALPKIPFHPFPYYEGMNRMGIDHYWLGLYWRNNLYNVKFLRAASELCMECKIGKICITPWKSFIIKGIPKSYKLVWEKLLGSYGINVRHSLLELNWRLPVDNPEALELKRFLVRNFDQNDISTYGLTFGIHSKYSVPFTAVVIEKNPPPTVVHEFQVRDSYNVLYAKNFDPNTLEYQVYAQDVDKIELPGLLMELSKLYFQQLGKEREEQEKSGKPAARESNPVRIEAYQCPDCQTIYDPAYGDSYQNIPAKTPFEQLPADYVCSVCETPVSKFVKLTRFGLEIT